MCSFAPERLSRRIMTTMDAIAINIAGFAFNPITREPVILLKRAGEPDPVKRLVPIVMGASEAHAIITALQGSEPPRPMTHDLMASIMTTLQGEAQRVDIHSFRDGTYFATLTIMQNGVTFMLDTRPSDAIALAVRCGTPLFMNEKVFDATSVETNVVSQQVGPNVDASSPQAAQILNAIHNFAENVQPSDFKTP